MRSFPIHVGRLLLILATVFGLSAESGIFAQDSEIYKAVPENQRDRLQSRVQEFVFAHKDKNWARVYDMLGYLYKNSAEKPYSKDEFITKKLYSKLKNFVPQSVQKMDESSWMIGGCGSWSDGGKMRAALEAYLENEIWYFSEIWSVVPCVDCQPESCKVGRKPTTK